MNTNEALAPKWDKWLKMIDAIDFQLVALSLNYEPPSTLKTITRFQGLSCYADRLSIIKNHITNKQLPREQRRYNNTDKFENHVQLDAFVKWAIDVMGWDLPPELLTVYNVSAPLASSHNLILNEQLLTALQTQNELNKKIQELEKQLEGFKNKPHSGECCNLKNEYYPPELHIAIQVWEALYLHGGANLERDSHSADVEKWIRNNTDEWIKDKFTKNSRALERIKVMTTPIKKKVTPSK